VGKPRPYGFMSERNTRFEPVSIAAIIIAALLLAIRISSAFSSAPSFEQSFEGKTISVQIGDMSVLSLEYRDYPGPLAHVAFINVHEDETAALAAGRALAEKHGGRVVALHYGGGRRIQFAFRGAMYVVDANRIYTPAGRAASMRMIPLNREIGGGRTNADAAATGAGRAQSGSRQSSIEDPDDVLPSVTEQQIDSAAPGVTDSAALAEMQRFADLVLASLEGFEIVVALHNDSDGGWSVDSYLDEPDSASAVYVAMDTDTDDFFIVTQRADYDAITALQMSCVLQNNGASPDDGSLSDYFRSSPVRYINCEAEDGEAERQGRMLEGLIPQLTPSIQPETTK